MIPLTGDQAERPQGFFTPKRYQPILMTLVKLMVIPDRQTTKPEEGGVSVTSLRATLKDGRDCLV